MTQWKHGHLSWGLGEALALPSVLPTPERIAREVVAVPLKRRLQSWRPPPQLSAPAHQVLRLLDTLGWVPSGRTTYLGHTFVYPLDSLIGRHIAGGEEWDEILVKIVPKLLPMEAPVIIEVGSNIGASLVQLKRAKPLAQVIAFEPSDRFRPFLEKNVKLAGLQAVKVSPSLLGRRRGTAWLYNNTASASVSRPRDAQVLKPRRKQAAAMTTLDTALEGNADVHFIKVDTDGFDFEVLRGAEATIERNSPILYFEFFPALLASPEADLTWLQTVGYRRFVCFTPSGELAGQTADVAQATTWAADNDYCDLLTCRAGSHSELQLDGLEGLLT